MKNWIRIAGIFGFFAVGLGAFGAHALKDVLTTYQEHLYQTAVGYHFIHTLAILGIGLLSRVQKVNPWPAYCFSAGILLFSGSLYLLAVTGITWLGVITPLGGVALLAGWVGVIVQATE